MAMKRQRAVFATALLLWITAVGFGPGALASEADDGGQPHGGDGHHGLVFSHPLVSNTPEPENLFRFGYSYSNEPAREHHHEHVPGADRHSLRMALEYAPIREFSLEVFARYEFLNPDGESSQTRFGNMELIGKYANFAFEDLGLLLGGGLQVVLPTGNEERGIGSSHVFELEPFVDFGYQRDRFELIGFGRFGIPLNEGSSDEPDLELRWNLSFLYRLTNRFHGLVEFDGLHVYGGEEDGFDMVNIAPGFKVQVLKDRKLSLGAALRLPLTQDKEFYVEPRIVAFYNF
jgi:hypothetical protein